MIILWCSDNDFYDYLNKLYIYMQERITLKQLSQEMDPLNSATRSY